MDKTETPDVVGLSAGLGLVNRLRAELVRTVELDMMHHEAANEIERLRAELAAMKWRKPLADAAAERERLRAMLEMAYCQKTGADSPHGLASCDNFKDWLTTLGA